MYWHWTVLILKSIPTAWGRPKKGVQSIGKSRAGNTTKIHAVVADVNLPIGRRLSSGAAGDSPEGQVLMLQIPKTVCYKKPLLMDKAYEGDECRQTARSCGMKPVVPPKSNRVKPWRYSKSLYKRRNIVERHFRNIKEFRQVFTRYDKLDETYNPLVTFANICIYLRN
jgi:transposase